MSDIKCRIKKGDTVIVIAGKDKGKTGEVLQVLPKKSTVVVKEVNVVKKHQKPSNAGAGSIVTKEMPINISNVAYLDPKENKPTKVGYKIEDNKKVRYAKLSGSIL